MRVALFLWLALLAPLALVAQEAPDPGADREVHVVALYEGAEEGGKKEPRVASVTVDRPGKKVTLVLSGHESIHWTLRTTAGSALKKIILAGNQAQVLKNPPAGAEIIDTSGPEPPGVHRLQLTVPHEINRVAFRQAVAALHKLTKQEISSFSGKYQAEAHTPILVRRVQRNEKLLSTYPRPTPAKELPKVEFFALNRFATPAGGFAHSYGPFNLQGPLDRTHRAAPHGLVQVAHDTANDAYYAVGSQAYLRVDFKDGSAKPWKPEGELPKASWESGTTFDAKRKRLILSDREHLFAYDVVEKRWTVLADLGNIRGYAAIAYAEKADRLYALGAEDEAEIWLEVMNPAGAALRRIKLRGPIMPDLVDPVGTRTRTQLVASGEHLVMITSIRDEEHAEAFIYLIDPKTGAMQLTARY